MAGEGNCTYSFPGSRFAHRRASFRRHLTHQGPCGAVMSRTMCPKAYSSTARLPEARAGHRLSLQLREVWAAWSQRAGFAETRVSAFVRTDGEIEREQLLVLASYLFSRKLRVELSWWTSCEDGLDVALVCVGYDSRRWCKVTVH